MEDIQVLSRPVLLAVPIAFALILHIHANRSDRREFLILGTSGLYSCEGSWCESLGQCYLNVWPLLPRVSDTALLLMHAACLHARHNRSLKPGFGP